MAITGVRCEVLEEAKSLPQNPERFEWIETAKGLGLLSVITVHSMIPDVNPGTLHLSSFTIPLFFVMAGLTYNNDRYRGNLRGLFGSRGRQYLIPYFVLYVAMTCLLLILGPHASTDLTADQLVYWLAYGAGPPGSATHLWFLPVFFFGLVLFALTDRAMMGLPRQSKLLLLVVFPMMAVLVESAFEPALVPWHANAIFVSATFMVVGNELRHVRGLTSWGLGSTARDLSGLLLVGVLVTGISTMNGFTDLAVDNTGASIWLYIMTGTLGSLSVFLLSSIISRSGSIVHRVLTRIGSYSQEVYEVHPVMFYLIPIVVVLLGGTVALYASFYALLWPARLILSAIVSLVIIEYVMSRYRVARLLFRGSTSLRLR